MDTISDILTSTQMKVLILQVKNYSVEETATELKISEGTVNVHRNAIKKRTEKAGFPSYIDYARHIGLMDNWSKSKVQRNCASYKNKLINILSFRVYLSVITHIL